jgi:hypothetical protein
MEERESLSKTAEKSHVPESILLVPIFDDMRELQDIETICGAADDLVVGIRDPDDIPDARALRIVDP